MSIASYARYVTETISLGRARAWRDDDGRWSFTKLAKALPADAIEVDIFLVAGKVVLREATDGVGRFIHGAKQVA